MFVLLMIPKQSSNKSAHGWHAKYFYRNEFRSYIFQSDTGPSLSLCSRPLFTFLSLMSSSLQGNSPSTLLEKTWVQPLFQKILKSILTGWWQSCPWLCSLCPWVTVIWVARTEGLEEAFPRTVFWCCLPQEKVTSVSQFKLDTLYTRATWF